MKYMEVSKEEKNYIAYEFFLISFESYDNSLKDHLIII